MQVNPYLHTFTHFLPLSRGSPHCVVLKTMLASWGTATQRKCHGRGGKSSAISQPSVPAPPYMQVQGPSDAANTLGPPPARLSTTLHINWNSRRIQALISWITIYPADHHVLCHDGSRLLKSQSSAPKLPSGEKAKLSGKTKKDVVAGSQSICFKMILFMLLCSWRKP
jgi:hypothetical protein